ncbi:hypothetical protein NGM10_01805 [Halorussus salilacus]|uniref:DUF7524 family protein n=1 Tax=Halorussus salilacus TaxID=2953750 RepID=UPI00209CC253|nr:hypothetical protein [Halorussus salilacus]USZ68487.1 hypothetical protein NGM10_01805 [Halorussus salilacus]
MSESLSVDLNDERLHDIRTAAAFEATDSFPILLKNGDAPVHVHLHLDDALSEVASIPANNHFVNADTTRQVDVEVAEGPRPVEGRLKIVTGHGAETAYVDVSVVEPDESADAVDVDETLRVPARDPDGDPEGQGFDLPDLRLAENAPVVALGLLALAAAVSSAMLADSAVVLLGALAVVGSLATAGYLLVR